MVPCRHAGRPGPGRAPSRRPAPEDRAVAVQLIHPLRPPREGTTPRLFTIPPGVPFVDALAAELLARAQAAGDPLGLARATILLPTRRACRALREAFLRRADGAALLLPSLMPLGDVDLDEIELRQDEAGGEPLAEADVAAPLPLSGLRRQLLLARLIRADGLAAPEQAVQLARELARLLDQAATERRDLADLRTLVPEDYAEHWQKTLRFLAILIDRWPAVLRAEGAIDPATHRDQVLGAQAALWRDQPPAHPVIAAGTTGSIPATADLLAVIATLPQGAIVLPGLDQAMPDAAWAQLDAGHPQYGLKLLLERLGTARADVAAWPDHGLAASPPLRARWLSCAMLPAAASDGWNQGVLPAEPLAGVARVDCAGPQEEAGVIALALREVLERPGETGALVTPDRSLARRVAAELRRFDIAIDDSAGVPLDQTPPGVFLRLVAAVSADETAPVPLLALLKHPLAAGGDDPARFRRHVRTLERRLLRGPRPGVPLAALATLIRASEDRSPLRRERLARLVERLAALLAPLSGLLARRDLDLAALLRAHVAVAEALAATREARGPARLWLGDAGEAAAGFVAELLDAAATFPPMDGADYPALFDALLQGRVVRPRWGRHPRLAILGPLEARLQQADRIVLGGLNEGTWPAEPPVDAWLSRPMREAFGLPAPERRIGLSAHDVAQAFGAREVILTRAGKVDGAPTVASRWLQRLETVLAAAGTDTTRPAGDRWLGWYRGHTVAPAAARPWPAPAPTPPVAARPRRLSVTAVERWMRDPYEIYARFVLRLAALEPLDADPGAAERGQFIHAALDRFVRDCPGALPDDALARLLAHGRAAFGASLERPSVWAFWWPRFERIARWVVTAEQARRRDLAAIATECRGALAIAAPAGPFTLTALADRIERRHDGGLVVIDYKTGQPPKWDEVTAGLAPQLPLEAVIAAGGGFPGVAADAVAGLAYWRLSGGEPAGEIKELDAAQLAAVVDAAAQGLRALVARYDDPATAYPARPRPDRAPAYSDYGHLARVKEWAGGEEAP